MLNYTLSEKHARCYNLHALSDVKWSKMVYSMLQHQWDLIYISKQQRKDWEKRKGREGEDEVKEGVTECPMA